MNKKLFGLLSVISTSILALTVIFAAKPNWEGSALALMRTPQYSGEYTNEFSMRAMVNGIEKLLTYGGGTTISETNNIAESICSITFIDNDTITIQNGDYYIGYKSGTDLQNSATEWDLVNGQVQHLVNTTNRTLSYRTSTYNVGRPYAVSNINNVEYYQIYFLTSEEFDAAEARCNWADSNRCTQLNNLSYIIPEQPVTYTISFNANGGSNSPAPITKPDGDSYTIPSNSNGITAPNGKTFDYWAYDAAGTEKASGTITVESNITLYAIWKDLPSGYTLDGTITGGTSNYATESEITQNNITWMVTGNTTMNPWRIGGKNLTNENRLVYSTTAMSTDIDEVQLDLGTKTLTLNSITIESSANSSFSTITHTQTLSTPAVSTVHKVSGSWGSNQYFRITFNVSAGSSNQYVQLKAVSLIPVE